MQYLDVFESSFCRRLGVVKQFECVIAGPRGQDLLGRVESQAGDLIYMVIQGSDNWVILHVLLCRLIHHDLKKAGSQA